MSKLVSVVIPVWNVEKYVEKCVRSVMRQSYENLEILVVDDGSPDGSAEICEKLAKEDARVKVLHKKNGGLSDARNFGIKKARGEWVALVDGDDFVKKDFIKELLAAAEESGAEIAICGYNTEIPKEAVLTGAEATRKLLIKQENLEIVSWNKLYKKALFNDIQYPVGEVNEDTLTTYKLLAVAEKVAYVDKSLYVYVERAGSITKEEDAEKRLSNRLRGAEEAARYFARQPELKSAAEVAVLLARYAYMDAAIRGEVDAKLYKENRAWVMKNAKKYRHNPDLTGKLKFYNLINFLKLYKVFRTIV